jgi:Putative manganese efflux pump
MCSPKTGLAGEGYEVVLPVGRMRGRLPLAPAEDNVGLRRAEVDLDATGLDVGPGSAPGAARPVVPGSAFEGGIRRCRGCRSPRGSGAQAAVSQRGVVVFTAAVVGGHGFLSISLDELAIGFSLGLVRLPVVPVIIAIAVQALLASQLGLALGHRISERFTERAGQLAAVALIGLGGYLIAERLLAQ